MPIHDWTKVRANRFHDFHQSWIQSIRNALNGGLLPEGYMALVEQKTPRKEPDVVALSLASRPRSGPPGGVSVLEAPTRTRMTLSADSIRYADIADTLGVYHPDGDMVAVIEIVSPGNKHSTREIRKFARKIGKLVYNGISVLIVDVFPGTRRDPDGVACVAWEQLGGDNYTLPQDQRLSCVAIAAGQPLRANVEPMAVGMPLPEMPLYLDEFHYINLPLEPTYMLAWDTFPKAIRGPLES